MFVTRLEETNYKSPLHMGLHSVYLSRFICRESAVTNEELMHNKKITIFSELS